MLLSINQLSQLTGRDRKTVTKQLENLAFIDGEKGAHLYESSEALPLAYAVDNLEAGGTAEREWSQFEDSKPTSVSLDCVGPMPLGFEIRHGRSL